MNEENQISYYSIIPATVRYDYRLKPAEKLMYGEITALANQMGYCFAQNKYERAKKYIDELSKQSNEITSVWNQIFYFAGLEEQIYF